MKKFLSILFICLLAFVIVGCGKDPEPDPVDPVVNYALSIAEADKTVSLKVGDEKTVVVTFEGGTLEWSSSDSSVVSIDNGKIKALKAGTATITVKLKEAAEYSATITVTVTEAAPAVIEVTGITLSNKNTELELGETLKVSATVEPSNATDKTVTWASSDTTVATVKDGLVTALKAGTTEISATAGSKTEKFTLTVTEPAPVLATSIFIDPGKVVFHIGETDEAYAEVDLDADDQTIVWSTSDTNVITIDQNGLITAVGAGKADVIATTHDGSNLSESYTVLVYADVTELTIQGEAAMVVNGSQKLTAKVNSDSASDLIWTSSDPETVSVGATGIATALKEGTATIKCKADDSTGMEKEITITVTYVPVTAIEVTGDKKMSPGAEQTLTATINVNANVPLKFTSSDTKIATVDEKGKVTAIDEGTVKITIEAQDRDKFSVEYEILIVSVEVSIGTTYYQNLPAALEAAQEGDTINIGGGTYTKALTINKSNITIQGEDTVFTGTITIADGVHDLTIKNITLKEKAVILSPEVANAEGLKNITFIAISSLETMASGEDAGIHFYNKCEDFTFLDSYFSFSANRGIRFEKEIHNLTVDNCKFVNAASHWDTLRGMDLVDGEVNVTNCHFENTLQSLIQFRYIGNGTYNVLNNTFKAAACVSVDMREAKTADFEGKAVINIKFNTFDGGANTWGTIRLRNSWASGVIENALEKVEVNFNYNKFLNITFGNNKYYVDKPTDNCTEGAWNLDYNYSDMGLPQLGGEGEDNWFCNMQKSCEGWFTSVEALDAAIATVKINEDDSILTVGTYEGITKPGYDTLALALAAAKEGDTIILLPGSHTGDVKVTINNLTIKSLNGDYIPGQLVTRYEEATYAGKITIGKEVKNTVIKGIKFVGTSQILNEKGTAGTVATQATVTNNDGFTFINNIVESAATGKGFIYFQEAGNAYSHDITISNNTFKAVSGFSCDAMVWIDNNYNLVACDNVFSDMKVTKAAFYVNDQTKGLSGEFSTINSNVFKNINGSGLWINWLSPLPAGTTTCKVSIQNNTFEDITAYGFYLGKMNNTGDIYEYIKVMFNTFKNVKDCMYFQRVTGNAHVEAKYNTFYTVPTGFYVNNDSANQETSGGVSLDLTECLFLDNDAVITPDASKIKGDVTYTTTITSGDDLPGFDAKATAIKIDEIELFVGDEYQMTITYTPKNTTNREVQWQSSDPTVATIDASGVIKVLKAGTVTITATYLLNGAVTDSIELTFVDFREVVLYAEGNGILKPTETLDLTASIQGSNTTGEIEWSTSDATIATVANGKVTAVKAGKVTITAKIAGTEIATNIVLEVNELSDMDELLKLLVAGHRAVVENQKINYIGYESGYEKVPHQVYTSVNAYYAAEMPTIIQNRNTHILENTSGNMVGKLEFIVVHDTGAAGPTSNAKANSNWALNVNNTGDGATSWHYTVGNDGIYQQLDENVIAWHAGCGAKSGDTVKLYDTGVEADPDLRNRAVVTLSDDGYFVVNGTKTTIPLPSGATAANGTNRLGLGTIVKDGHYWLPETWVSSTYDNKICIRGGGTNAIGIESAVNTGSDVYLTWQYLAKLVADILIRNDLTPERVMFHNNFSNKTCPNTMINSDNIDMFLDMCYLEYYVKKNYSDYTITFTSNNPDIIDNSGRVIGVGPYKATNVSYTITVTKGTESQSVTLYSLVQGSHKH